MFRFTRPATIPVIALAAIVCAVPSAQARNGGAERENPAPAPAPVQTPAPTVPTPAPTPETDSCSDPRILEVSNPDEALVNAAGPAGCIAVRIHDGVFSVAAMVLNPGWTFSSKGSTTGGDRVKLILTKGKTSITYVVEPGRTSIR